MNWPLPRAFKIEDNMTGNQCAEHSSRSKPEALAASADCLPESALLKAETTIKRGLSCRHSSNSGGVELKVAGVASDIVIIFAPEFSRLRNAHR